MERRQFVIAIAASTVLSAGCISDSAPAPDDGNSENGSDPDETDNADGGNSTNESNVTMGWHGDPDINSPDDSGMELQDPPSCGGSLIPLSDMFDEVEYGQFEYETGATFELEVEPDPVALCEGITATLRWVSGEEDSGFGTGEMYTVEWEADGGWESIYRVPASQPELDRYGLWPAGIVSTGDVVRMVVDAVTGRNGEADARRNAVCSL